jgi:hypothetical protein
MPLKFSVAKELLEDGAGAESKNYHFLMRCCPEFRREMLKVFVSECKRRNGNISNTITYIRLIYGNSVAEEAEVCYRQLLEEKGGEDAGN